ncbi:hypothetical protein GY45DRAFT_1257511, partial [Cubamyces sp. BRFM 1775]
MRAFVWGEGKAPKVALTTLQGPYEEGGIALLDLEARNVAIDLVWLRDYLRLTERRPAWATLADVLLANAVSADTRGAPPATRLNAFLQSWKVSSRTGAGLPLYLRRMVKFAAKYHVTLDVAKPSADLCAAMPIWYHPSLEVKRDVARTPVAQCLRERHGVKTVGQCASMAARVTYPDGAHRAKSDCACDRCLRDRIDKGCENPHRCALAASRLVARLHVKWRPSNCGPEDGLSLTPSQRERNEVAHSEQGRILFDPSLTQALPLASAFRAFVGGADRQTLARRARPYRVADEEVEVYTDGACRDNGLASAAAGGGMWFGPGDVRNASERVPGQQQSNQTAELYAVEMAHRVVPPFVTLHVVTD